jgi:signal transduction histidine kinase
MRNFAETSLGSADAHQGVVKRAIGIPLLHKLIVTDTIINILAFLGMRSAPAETADDIVLVALVFTLVLNAALVYWALLPLRTLESTATRVSQGDLEARVPFSRLADRDISRIGTTLNRLLDNVTADQIRMRALAAQVISAGDQERAHIARELHDVTAQSLSALEMLVTTSLREVPAADAAGTTTGTTTVLHERLGVMREIVVEALAEVRTLSHNVHPRVLDDLGLVAALEFLARRTREQSGIGTHVTTDMHVIVPPAVASVLYRVTQEAVRNVIRHARASDVHVTLTCVDGLATLEVVDMGVGFDVAAKEADRSGMGLFMMRERLALIDGTLIIKSVPGRSTTVRAVVPIPPHLPPPSSQHVET